MLVGAVVGLIKLERFGALLPKVEGGVRLVVTQVLGKITSIASQ